MMSSEIPHRVSPLTCVRLETKYSSSLHFQFSVDRWTQDRCNSVDEDVLSDVEGADNDVVQDTTQKEHISFCR